MEILDDKNKPNNPFVNSIGIWYLAVAICFLVINALRMGNSAINIQIHDTYLVITIIYFLIILCAPLFLFGILHLIFTNKKYTQPHKAFSIVHIGTSLLLIMLLVNLFLNSALGGVPKRYYSIDDGAIESVVNSFIYYPLIVLGICLIIQVIYLGIMLHYRRRSIRS